MIDSGNSRVKSIEDKVTVITTFLTSLHNRVSEMMKKGQARSIFQGGVELRISILKKSVMEIFFAHSFRDS